MSILFYHIISPDELEWLSSLFEGANSPPVLTNPPPYRVILTLGVPQVGILSPLFSIFIKLITQKIQFVYHLHADDSQLYYHAAVSNKTETFTMINDDLDAISYSSDRYDLTVNPANCQTIILGSQDQKFRYKQIATNII